MSVGTPLPCPVRKTVAAIRWFYCPTKCVAAIIRWRLAKSSPNISFRIGNGRHRSQRRTGSRHSRRCSGCAPSGSTRPGDLRHCTKVARRSRRRGGDATRLGFRAAPLHDRAGARPPAVALSGMTRYTVVWLHDALDDLTWLWLAADDRDAVTAATARLDKALANNPTNVGQLVAEGLRRLAERPFTVFDEVRANDLIVEVVRVRRIRTTDVGP